MPVVTERGCLLIADISGYTDYVVSSPLEYAEEVVADITGDVVHRLEPLLHVNKLEGDAAFGYSLDGELGVTRSAPRRVRTRSASTPSRLV